MTPRRWGQETASKRKAALRDRLSRRGPIMKIIDSIASGTADIAVIRRDIHAHPELCFKEVRTADVVAKKLTEWGIPIHRGLGTTGVVGIVKQGSSSRAIGFRAHTDALPMQEFNTFLCQPKQRQDARLRPRRTHRHAAGSRAAPGHAAKL